MLFFIVPALNERASMPRLAESLSAACRSIETPFHVILVDDGSSDGTSEAALEAFGDQHCKVVRFESNRGPGAAMDAGLREALGQAGNEDLIVTLEADGTSDLAILPDLLSAIRSGNDIALASPFAEGGGIVGTSLVRHLLSRTANFLCETCLGIHGIATYSSFYRVHTKEILDRLYSRYGARTVQEAGFTYAVEMLAKSIRVGARVSEVPMVLDTKMRIGQSRMRIGRTILRYFVLFARLGLSRSAPRRQPAAAEENPTL